MPKKRHGKKEARRLELERKRWAEQLAERVVGHLVHDHSGTVYRVTNLREAGAMFSAFQTDCR